MLSAMMRGSMKMAQRLRGRTLLFQDRNRALDSRASLNPPTRTHKMARRAAGTDCALTELLLADGRPEGSKVPTLTRESGGSSSL